MRDRRLAERELVDDVADADRRVVAGEEVEDADARRVRERLEPARVFLRLSFAEIRGRDWAA